MGILYHDINGIDYLIFLLLGAFPSLFYKGIINIASALSVMVYIFGIIPCYHSLWVGDPLSISTFWGYAIAFIFSGTLFFLTDSIYLLKSPFLKTRKKYISIKTIEIITLLMLIILVVTYSSQMRFVNFFEDQKQLYAQRAENSSLSVLGLVLYFRQWLTNGFFPFLLVIYLQTKNRLKTCAVLLGYFLVFLIEMAKSTFFMPIIILSFYAIMKYRKNAIRNYYYSGILFTISVIAILLFNTYQNSTTMFGLAAIFIMRTMCVSGWLCNMYIPFFENNPFTYFTHINIINFITQAYPYADSIGLTVSYGDQNANAFFLLMDGVAGAGIYGIYIVSMVFIFIKGILNSISLKYKKSLCILIFLPATMAIVNVSIFTAILTCGLLILYLLFMFVKAPMLQINHRSLKAHN